MTDSIAATRNDWDDLSESGDGRDQRGRPNWTDVLFFVVLAVGAGYALSAFNSAMDYYEQTILVLAVPAITWLGWLWRPLRTLLVVTGMAAGFAIWLYQGDIARAEQVFFLKYLFSSQSAILWMCALFVLATF